MENDFLPLDWSLSSYIASFLECYWELKPAYWEHCGEDMGAWGLGLWGLGVGEVLIKKKMEGTGGRWAEGKIWILGRGVAKKKGEGGREEGGKNWVMVGGLNPGGRGPDPPPIVLPHNTDLLTAKQVQAGAVYNTVQKLIWYCTEHCTDWSIT